MSAARLFASAIAFAGFVLYGAVERARKLSSLSDLHSLAEDVNELAVRLCAEREPLPDLLKRIRPDSEFSALWTHIADQVDNGYAPSAAFAGAADMIADKQAQRMLYELFAVIGTGDAEAEVKRLRRTADALSALETEAAARAGPGIKLNNSLSVMMGLAAALLLL